jgi:hypothetical protein
MYLVYGLSLWMSCGHLSAQENAGTVDVFMGAELNYRDIYFNNRVFDVLVNLTPGVKWHMGNHWNLAAQMYVPLVNQYGGRYKKVRLKAAVLSKQMKVGRQWKMKFTGGWFTQERYGLDWKSMYVVSDWLAMTAQVGYTGYYSMAVGWEASPLDKLTALVGSEVFLKRWNLHLLARGGRYIYEDYGGVFEIIRHYKHVSMGVFASYSDWDKEDYGFKIVMMIPPYKRKLHKVNIRPANNFRFTYSSEANFYGNLMYSTDPEQNERTGWFDRDLLPWGPETIEPDYVIEKGGEQ